MSVQTAERVSLHEQSDNVIFQRHLVAYRHARQYTQGNALEVGCGEGYGLAYLAPLAQEYTAIDKYSANIEAYTKDMSNIYFVPMSVPPIGFADSLFDVVVTFQVIEHIEDDKNFVKEIYRVLKPGGKLVLTTPNRYMSLTRNPWHVREYTTAELHKLLASHFPQVEMNGVYGNDKVMQYYEENKRSVARFTRFDLLNLQYRLPRQLLQIPYDLLNRLNRRLLLKGNKGLVSNISADDYHVAPANDLCFDLLAVATKA